jgi:sialic acid synthase SpsE
MSKIILDFGSGNTCKNRTDYIETMYNELKKVDNNKHEIIVKWQLFTICGFNLPLAKDSFNFAYEYGKKLGYQVTASVFDKESLDFLINFDIPFVKLANRRDTDYLINYIPVNIPIYISKDNSNINFDNKEHNITEFFCISKYPANIKDYEDNFQLKENCYLSDHTDNFDLYKKYNPSIVEWHYKLDYSTGLDSGPFARTPAQLNEIL